MVHGNEEFHGAVKKAVSGSNPDEAKERNGSWTWNVAGCDFRDRTGVQGRTKSPSLSHCLWGNDLDFEITPSCDIEGPTILAQNSWQLSSSREL